MKDEVPSMTPARAAQPSRQAASMSVQEKARFRLALEHEDGDLLRLKAPEHQAMKMASGLLEFLEADVGAERLDARPHRGFRLRVADPVLLRLESLEIELSTDGIEVELWRVRGSENDFNDLCELISSEFLRG